MTTSHVPTSYTDMRGAEHPACVTATTYEGAAVGGWRLHDADPETMREVRDRVRSSLLNAGFVWPAAAMRLELEFTLEPDAVPPCRRFPHPEHDWPILLAVLAVTHQLDGERLQGHIWRGMVSLDGRISHSRARVDDAVATLTHPAWA